MKDDNYKINWAFIIVFTILLMYLAFVIAKCHHNYAYSDYEYTPVSYEDTWSKSLPLNDNDI